MREILLLAGAYLLGSVSFAVLVGRAAGLGDPRRAGSGNPGATNVLRLGGKKAAALTLLGDLLKGTLAVIAARALGADALLLAGVALAVFLGHLYPLYFGFRGGKGVATALGAWLGLDPWVALALLVTWLAVAGLFRISSLAALAAAALAPLYVYLLDPLPPYLALSGVLAVLLFWRHRANLRKLLAGTEPRIGAS